MRKASYGTYQLSFLDRFGIWLSRRAIIKQIKDREKLSVLELGCGYSALNLLAIEDRATKLVGVDFNLSAEVKRHPKIVPLEYPAVEALERLLG